MILNKIVQIFGVSALILLCACAEEFTSAKPWDDIKPTPIPTPKKEKKVAMDKLKFEVLVNSFQYGTALKNYYFKEVQLVAPVEADSLPIKVALYENGFVVFKNGEAPENYTGTWELKFNEDLERSYIELTYSDTTVETIYGDPDNAEAFLWKNSVKLQKNNEPTSEIEKVNRFCRNGLDSAGEKLRVLMSLTVEEQKESSNEFCITTLKSYIDEATDINNDNKKCKDIYKKYKKLTEPCK